MSRWILPEAATIIGRKYVRRGESKPCKCSHEWGVHGAVGPPHPCLVVGCECDVFADAASSGDRGPL